MYKIMQGVEKADRTFSPSHSKLALGFSLGHSPPVNSDLEKEVILQSAQLICGPQSHNSGSWSLA